MVYTGGMEALCSDDWSRCTGYISDGRKCWFVEYVQDCTGRVFNAKSHEMNFIDICH